MCAVVNLQGHRGAAEALSVASSDSFALFSGGADGKVFKWERWQINPLIHTFEAYPCDVTDPVFVHNYDIHIVSDDSLSVAQKRRIASAPPSLKRSSLAGNALSLSGSYSSFKDKQGSVKPANSMTASLFCDSLDILVVGGLDTHIYIWGFDETEAYLAENADTMKVGRCLALVPF
jgi:hypothetical protein